MHPYAVGQRHVPLKHEAEEAGRKAAAAKRGLRAVLAELRGMHAGQGLEDSDWEAEDAVCVVCGGGEADDANDIAVCDRCLCPFHQRCCHPHVTAQELGEEDEEWWCRRCNLVYDTISNAVLDACGVDEPRRRTFKRVESLLETDGEGGGGDEGEEEEEEEEQSSESEEEEEEEGGKPAKGKGKGGSAAASEGEDADSGAGCALCVLAV